MSARPVAEQIAWRTTAPEGDFLRRWSLQHRVVDGANRALCGAAIRWLYVGPGDGRRCRRCEALAAKRDLLAEHEDPWPGLSGESA